ncbi:hypothetical protein Tco_0162700 [Tanacetum coccineum]
MKNNPVCKENASNVFRKEREQYHEIQDLKAQMQDKNMVISELKKLIENCKGKSVETQFNKPSVVRQPNAQRIPKPSVLGKPTPFSNSPEMRSFQTEKGKDGKNPLMDNKREYIAVEKSSASKKPDRQIPTGGFPKWKGTNSCKGKFKPRSSMFKRRLIAADQASVFMAITSVHISSGLVLHQMTSDHNCSELGIQDHSNEQSSSKLVPKVVPLAVVRLGINPMIQPEPEDLPKDNPKLEIAVLRSNGGDENPIRTLGDYSKPSHEGYRNTIELPVGNNVLLDWKPPPLPAGSITTWEDLTTLDFLAQFFPPERTAKLRNDILMFQQHHDPTSATSIQNLIRGSRCTDYMQHTTEQIEFENSFSSKREEINGKMTEMFGLLKTLTTIRPRKNVIEKRPIPPSPKARPRQRMELKAVTIPLFIMENANPSCSTSNREFLDHHHLGEVVFGKPFARKTGLVYDPEEGTVTFEKDNKKITFKMPHKMESFNHMDSKDVNTDSIPPFVLKNNDDRGKTYHLDSLTLRPEYREDKSISKEIRHLTKLEREAKRHKGEVT